MNFKKIACKLLIFFGVTVLLWGLVSGFFVYRFNQVAETAQQVDSELSEIRKEFRNGSTENQTESADLDKTSYVGPVLILLMGSGLFWGGLKWDSNLLPQEELITNDKSGLSYPRLFEVFCVVLPIAGLLYSGMVTLGGLIGMGYAVADWMVK